MSHLTSRLPTLASREAHPELYGLPTRMGVFSLAGVLVTGWSNVLSNRRVGAHPLLHVAGASLGAAVGYLLFHHERQGLIDLEHRKDLLVAKRQMRLEELAQTQE